MKSKLWFVCLFLLVACQKEETFYIYCDVKAPDGMKLVYSIEGEDFENRQEQTVVNGKAKFVMRNDTKEFGYIESKYNLDEFSFMRRFVKILPEDKNVNVSFEVKKDSMQVDDNVFDLFYNIGEPLFQDGINKSFSEFISKKFENLEGYYLSYSIMDSLHQYVYPTYKKKLLSLYENDYQDTNNPYLKLEILHSLIDKTLFKPEHLKKDEIEKINAFFQGIDKQIINNSMFELQKLVRKMNNITPDKLVFSDFTFKNQKNQKKSLSSFVQQNKYTMFYFWTEGCGPCKKFNNQLSSDYNILRKNGIEVVHINVDLKREYWERATKRDSIYWPNLYAGKDFELHRLYRIEAWPTKVIFNANKELVELDVKTPKDLLNLKNN